MDQVLYFLHEEIYTETSFSETVYFSWSGFGLKRERIAQFGSRRKGWKTFWLEEFMCIGASATLDHWALGRGSEQLQWWMGLSVPVSLICLCLALAGCLPFSLCLSHTLSSVSSSRRSSSSPYASALSSTFPSGLLCLLIVCFPELQLAQDFGSPWSLNISTQPVAPVSL